MLLQSADSNNSHVYLGLSGALYILSKDVIAPLVRKVKTNGSGVYMKAFLEEMREDLKEVKRDQKDFGERLAKLEGLIEKGK